jgi:hypothetical protein
MVKSIGYYTSYTPGDESYLERLQEEYGSRFEQMSKREKLFLISSIASQMVVKEPGRTRAEIHELAATLPENLPRQDCEGLLEALIAQVRWG